MAPKALQCLWANVRHHGHRIRAQTRGMATETTMPSHDSIAHAPNVRIDTSHTAPEAPRPIGPSTVLTTVYRFPSMEPLRFASYPANHLYLPLRRDILHRAVIYEGDKTRQGTASTKWRDEVHGSGRKIRPQKGTGKARLGDKKSPMLRGGGVAFGPKPRDFSTDLPRKIYDLAWRIAFSYRYRRGQLIIVDNLSDLRQNTAAHIEQVFETNGWGRSHGRTLVVSDEVQKNLTRGLEASEKDGKAMIGTDVDVKNLLEMGRVVIEKRVLDQLLEEHQSDLTRINQLVMPVAQ